MEGSGVCVFGNRGFLGMKLLKSGLISLCYIKLYAEVYKKIYVG